MKNSANQQPLTAVQSLVINSVIAAGAFVKDRVLEVVRCIPACSDTDHLLTVLAYITGNYNFEELPKQVYRNSDKPDSDILILKSVDFIGNSVVYEYPEHSVRYFENEADAKAYEATGKYDGTNSTYWINSDSKAKYPFKAIWTHPQTSSTSVQDWMNYTPVQLAEEQPYPLAASRED